MSTTDIMMIENLAPVPFGFCHCRCGQRTRIAKESNSSKGWVRGQPIRFRSGHNTRLMPHGPRPYQDPGERYWPQVDKSGSVVRPELGPCWLWTGSLDKDGYGFIEVNGRRRKAHHVSLEFEGYYMIPEAFGKQEAGHLCDTPSCVRPRHLKIWTKQDNLDDMVAKGRQARGERQGNAKLTEALIHEIRALYQRGVRGRGCRALAKQFDLSESHVRRIIRGETWRHLYQQQAAS